MQIILSTRGTGKAGVSALTQKLHHTYDVAYTCMHACYTPLDLDLASHAPVKEGHFPIQARDRCRAHPRSSLPHPRQRG